VGVELFYVFALVALGCSAAASGIIVFTVNRHQKNQAASFQQSLFEIGYHLGKARRIEMVEAIKAAPSLF
jgi:hypothetical protein